MKVTWNELVIEGTPLEIQSFLTMCNMLPIESQTQPSEPASNRTTEWQHALYRDLLQKSYYGKMFVRK
jgi:hypothetical protein